MLLTRSRGIPLIVALSLFALSPNVGATPPQVFCGKWEGRIENNGKLTIDVPKNPVRKGRVTISSSISSRKESFEALFSYSYADPDIYPLLSFYYEREGDVYERHYIYVVPGLLKGKYVLRGFYEFSRLINEKQDLMEERVSRLELRDIEKCPE